MEWQTYLRAVIALGAVLALIALTAWALRRFGLAGVMGAPAGGARRRRRLAVAEVMAVDARNRLVLVRRDGVEHLLLVGGSAALVVESGIVPSAATAPATAEGS